MKHVPHRRHGEERGFTLIELLVVVIIIGILASIAIPAFLSQRQRGWQAQLTADVRNAILDVEALYVNNDGEYPSPAQFEALGAATSDDAIVLAYQVNDTGTVFCVQGTDSRQPVGSQQVARYISGSGVQLHEVCPTL